MNNSRTDWIIEGITDPGTFTWAMNHRNEITFFADVRPTNSRGIMIRSMAKTVGLPTDSCEIILDAIDSVLGIEV